MRFVIPPYSTNVKCQMMVGDVCTTIIRAIQELVYYGTGCFCQGEDLLHDRYLHHGVDRDHFREHLLALVLVGI